MKIKSLTQTALLATAMVSTAGMVQADEFVTIGTGGVTGVYYPTGGAICRFVNKERKEHGVRCTVESTGGSVYNINTIRQGELDLGVAQSDLQYQSFHGEGEFASQGNYEDLRAVFSLHSEPFTVVARKDSGIKTFADLKGKRVNVGNPGSGQRATIEVVMDAYGWTMDDFKLASQLKSAEQSKELCDNKIDAMVFVAGHPSGSIKEATTACDSVIVEVAGEKIDGLIAKYPYFKTATVPGGMYQGNPDDVMTFGVAATLVSSATVSEKSIYHLVKGVFENFDDFKGLHPAFGTLDKAQMVKEGLSAPLHSGAAKYYKEAGLIE